MCKAAQRYVLIHDNRSYKTRPWYRDKKQMLFEMMKENQNDNRDTENWQRKLREI
jgi:hypothetical protein